LGTATSIQKTRRQDSIIAHGLLVADFIDSIDQPSAQLSDGICSQQRAGS
jgi:hypothetical protein